ncbi:hypothetical protein MTO96_049929 [Rhipicephalus appendiculatus]
MPLLSPYGAEERCSRISCNVLACAQSRPRAVCRRSTTLPAMEVLNAACGPFVKLMLQATPALRKTLSDAFMVSGEFTADMATKRHVRESHLPRSRPFSL